MKILFFGEKNEFVTSLINSLKQENFSLSFTTGKNSLDEIANKVIPDIILVDSSLNYKQPLGLIKEIKKHEILNGAPVFLLTEEELMNDLDKHIDIGADEVLIKPFDLRYLTSRIKLTIRMFNSRDNNPLTGLPGNNAISKRLNQIISPSYNGTFGVIYSDLDHFKPYNDIYGFSKGDEVITYTAELLKLAMQKFGNPEDFLGHIGGDDYILITTYDKIEAISKFVCSEFDKHAPTFYSEEDQKNGKILSKDRDGNKKEFGFLSISLASVTNKKRKFDSLTDLAKVAAGVKKAAKKRDNSSWIIDRRDGNDDKKDSFVKKENTERRVNTKTDANILVIDDSRFITDFIKDLLVLEGYEVETLNDAEKGLFHTQIKEYNLIIVDLSMPKMDGLTLIKNIKKGKLNPKTPIIVVSAYNQKQMILESIKVGVKKFFVKPFNNKDFIATIDKLVKERG